LLIVFCAALLWAARRDGRTILAVEGAGAIAIIGTLLSLAGTISRYEDSTTMVRNLAPLLQAGDRVASYHAFVPTAIPYIKRPLYFFHFDNSSGLNDAEVARSPFYSTPLDDVDFSAWLDKPGRVFVVTEGFRGDKVASRLYLWGRTNDQFLLSNQPRPDDLNVPFNFVAPDRLRKTPLMRPSKDAN